MRKFLIIVALFFVTLGLGRYAYVSATTETITDTFVRDSERVCNADDAQKCRYLAFGKNETYENTDEWLFIKYNSSDVNRSLIRGNTCEIKVYGFRVPYFSWYRNIIKTSECTLGQN
jgi:hypothetical protein